MRLSPSTKLQCMARQVCSHVPILADAASERTLLYDADQVLQVLHGGDEEEGGAGVNEDSKRSAQAIDKDGPSSSKPSSSSCVVAVFAGHMHRGGCVFAHYEKIRTIPLSTTFSCVVLLIVP